MGSKIHERPLRVIDERKNALDADDTFDAGLDLKKSPAEQQDRRSICRPPSISSRPRSLIVHMPNRFQFRKEKRCKPFVSTVLAVPKS